MEYLTNKTGAIILALILITMQSCNILLEADNNIEMSSKLSTYRIFQGNQSNLIPSSDFTYYEISTQLFTDYTEKQRLIKLPRGNALTATNDGLPNFPDGTILVKTFYYSNDIRDEKKGKRIIETRLLIKSNSKWNVGTYVWNDEQTEAYLLTAGQNKSINWKNKNGIGKAISYHIPNNSECATCHNSSASVLPLGPKIRNLNIEIVRGDSVINPIGYAGAPWRARCMSCRRSAD